MIGSLAAKNIGAVIKTVNGGGGRGVAAGTGDNTKITGATINRMPAGAAGFLSCVIAALGRAVLTEAKVLKFALEYQESADGTNWDTAVPLYSATTVATGGTGGSTELAVKETDLDLSAKKQYIRFNLTPDLDASGTDTFEVMLAVTLGGADITPV